MKIPATVYLIPTFLDESGMKALPACSQAVEASEVFFVENERSARRYLKKIWPQVDIDRYSWFTIHKAEEQVSEEFLRWVKKGSTIGLLSEAGCPGIADPGQILVAAAQQAGAVVKPLVGPSSFLLALMASGMNGQHFQFHGYLPIEALQRARRIKELETISAKEGSAQPLSKHSLKSFFLESLLKTAGDPRGYALP